MRQGAQYSKVTTPGVTPENCQSLKALLQTEGKSNLTDTEIQEVANELIEFFELLAFDEDPLI